jgi:hypothetical protein
VDLSLWRDISLVWLALITFIGLVFPLVLFFFAVRGMHWVLTRVPLLSDKAQRTSRQMAVKADALSRQIAEPVIRARTAEHRGLVIWRRLWQNDRAGASQKEIR